MSAAPDESALIPFTDPIWRRGDSYDQDPTGELASLVENFDAAQAGSWFWEEMNYVGELFPRTYAALPWMWEYFPHDDDEVKRIFSFTVARALSTAPDEFERYQGLSLDLDDQPDYVSDEQRLLPEDLPKMERLQTWMDEHLAVLAEVPLAGIQQADAVAAASLMDGYLASQDPRTTDDQEYPSIRLDVNSGFILGSVREEPEGSGIYLVTPEDRTRLFDEMELDVPENRERFRSQIEIVKPLNQGWYDILASVAYPPGVDE